MSPIQSKAEALMKRLGLSFEHLLAIRFSINVAIATPVVWVTLKSIGDSNPIWEIDTVVSVSNPQREEANRMFKAGLSKGMVGYIDGLIFLLVGGTADWLLPLALATTVLISSFIIRIKTMWRQAPITAAVVIAAGVIEGTKAAGIEHGLHKVAEVIFGCFVGLIVSWLMSKVWIVQQYKQPQ